MFVGFIVILGIIGFSTEIFNMTEQVRSASLALFGVIIGAFLVFLKYWYDKNSDAVRTSNDDIDQLFHRNDGVRQAYMSLMLFAPRLAVCDQQFVNHLQWPSAAELLTLLSPLDPVYSSSFYDIRCDLERLLFSLSNLGYRYFNSDDLDVRNNALLSDFFRFLSCVDEDPASSTTHCVKVERADGIDGPVMRHRAIVVQFWSLVVIEYRLRYIVALGRLFAHEQGYDFFLNCNEERNSFARIHRERRTLRPWASSDAIRNLVLGLFDRLLVADGPFAVENIPVDGAVGHAESCFLACLEAYHAFYGSLKLMNHHIPANEDPQPRPLWANGEDLSRTLPVFKRQPVFAAPPDLWNRYSFNERFLNKFNFVPGKIRDMSRLRLALETAQQWLQRELRSSGLLLNVNNAELVAGQIARAFFDFLIFLQTELAAGPVSAQND